MKLCAPCIKVLEGHRGALCEECREQVHAVLLQQPPRMGRPECWVPVEGEHVGVPGMTRMGKSTWMKEETTFLMKKEVPVYWWDPQREASRHGIERENTPLGPLRTQITVSDLELDPAKWLKFRDGGKAPAIAVVPDAEYPSRADRAADFVRFMGLFLANKPKGAVVLFIEECGLLEGDRAAETALVEAATTWAKEGVTIFFGTQSTSMVPDRARRQWKVLVSFAQRDTYDLRAIRDITTARFAAAVKRLQAHECLMAHRMDLGPWEGDAENEDTAPEEAGAEQAA